MSADLDLAALLCSRLCHDLISPVGAVGNGLELLSPTSEDEADVRGLLSDSARTAIAALEFYRVAFGMVGEAASPLGWGELGGLAQGHLSGGRHKLEWPAGGDALGRGEAKLMLLLLLAGMSATPIGGVLRVRPADSAPLSLGVTATGRRAGLGEAALAMIAGPDAPLAETPREAHLTVLGRHAARLGATVAAAQEGPETVTLTATGR